ncbi:hypothetical protein HID58_029341 [Brassica napus]|uniref:Uncharacterized protein n=1 Tax=Brassica napus TaxID=3708 RepID=A0ABQ8CCX1_BRANA|nr:hypothetical protein HID58_029341 [Brassica napus]
MKLVGVHRSELVFTGASWCSPERDLVGAIGYGHWSVVAFLSVVREIDVASSDLPAASYDLAVASSDLAVASSDLFVASSNLAVASSDLAGKLCRVESRRRTRHRWNPSTICEMMRFNYREM